MYQFKLIVDKTKVNVTIENYSLLVSQKSNAIPDAFWESVTDTTNGLDIRFYTDVDDAPGVELKREVVFFDKDAEEVEAWVRLLYLYSDSNTIVWCQVANGTRANDADAWIDYSAYHFQETTGNIIDSATGGYDSAVAGSGTVRENTGKISNAINFTHLGYAGPIDPSEHLGATRMTITTLCKFTISGSYDFLFSQRQAADKKIGAFKYIDDKIQVDFRLNPNNGTIKMQNTVSIGEWHLIHVVYDGTEATPINRAKLYVDGVEVPLVYTSTCPTALPSGYGSDLMYFGGKVPLANALGLDGPIDEMRFGAYAKGSGWCLSESNMMLTPETFFIPLVVSFSATPLSGWTNLSVAFTDASMGVDTWAWDFGDGGTSTDENPVHIYQKQGVYTVSLTATASATGESDTETKINYVTATDRTAPIFRYRTTEIRMDGIKAPVFPVQRGETTHTYVTDKRKYTTTSRYHPTTDVSWQSVNVKNTDRDSVYDFWNTTLSKGYNDFTVVDHRRRILFEASWNKFNEKWRKQRGGVFDIEYPFQSSVGWTTTCLGAYFMTANDLESHLLNGWDLALDDGTLVNYAGDTDILRLNGYALKLADGAGTETGATGTVSWNKTKNNTSMTIFCQARTVGVADKLYLVDLNDGTNRVSIILDDVDGSNDYIKGEITTGATTGIVYKADTSSPSLPDDTWYDVCLTYEAVNGKWYLYYVPSEIGSSYTNFLDGGTALEDNILSTISESIGVADTTWTTLNLLRESAAGTLNSKDAYLQNVMILDDYVSPMQFNTFRRLCYLWNNKSTGTWPA